MDTSEEYIKMCDCPEIQDKHKPARGDLYVCACSSCRRPNQTIYMIEQHEIDCLNHRDLTDVYEPYKRMVQMSEVGGFPAYLHDRKAEGCGSYIWLPRQDQLQRMLPPTKGYALTWLGNSFYCYQGTTNNEIGNGKSGKEALLKAVMHELHGKTWDGERWKNHLK